MRQNRTVYIDLNRKTIVFTVDSLLYSGMPFSASFLTLWRLYCPTALAGLQSAPFDY